MHETDRSPDGFAIRRLEGVDHVGGPTRLGPDRLGTKEGLEERGGDDAIGTGQPVKQSQGIGLGEALPKSDGQERRGDGDQTAHAAGPTGCDGDTHMTAPRVAHPVHWLGDAQVIENLYGGIRAVVEREVAMDGVATSVAGTIDRHDVSMSAKRIRQRTMVSARDHPGGSKDVH